MLQAALRDGTADRRCVFEVFARRLPDGRRYGVVAGTGRLLERDRRLPVRRRASSPCCADAGVVDERDLRLAGRLPVRRRHLRLRRGRALLPRLADPHRRGHLRRGGAARDAGPVDPQPRLRGRLGRGPDGRTRPGDRPLHRDGLAAHPRGGRGRRRPGGLPRRLRRHLQPGGRAAATACPPRAPRRTRSPCCTTARATRSARRSRRWASARRCWSTPTTSRPGIAHRGRGRRPASSARSASTPATSPCWPTRPATLLDELGATTTRIVLSGDLDEYAIAALAAAPVDGYGVGTSLVTGSGAPTAGFVYKLVEVDGRAGGQAVGGQGRPTAAARPRCAGTGRPAPRPRRSCAPRASRRHATGDRALQHADASAAASPARRADPGRVPRAPAAGAHHPALAGSDAVPRRARDPHHLRGAADDRPPARVRRRPRRCSSSTCRTTSPTRPAGSTCAAASRSSPRSTSEVAAAQNAGATVVYTQDWHPASTPHFAKDGGIWPVHCVARHVGRRAAPATCSCTGRWCARAPSGEDGYSGFSVRDPVTGAAAPTQLQSLLDPTACGASSSSGWPATTASRRPRSTASGSATTSRCRCALTRFVELEDGRRRALGRADARRRGHRHRDRSRVLQRGSPGGRLGGMTFPQDAADLAEGGRMPLLGFGTWQIKGAKATERRRLRAGGRLPAPRHRDGLRQREGRSAPRSPRAGWRATTCSSPPSARRARPATSSTRCARASTCSAPTTSTSG